jgi:hypothetical protein
MGYERSEERDYFCFIQAPESFKRLGRTAYNFGGVRR